MDNRDREILRSLAGRYTDLASLSVMQERKRQWTALKDLHAERPMVLFETWFLEHYVVEEELECRAPDLRDVERRMRWLIRHAEEVGDDLVLEPHWRVYWQIEQPDYGVEIRSRHAEDTEGGQVAYAFDHPLRTPQDVGRLRPRTWRVDREETRRLAEELAKAFGDILPVVIQGKGGLHAGLTGQLFRLIGNDNLFSG